MYRAFWVFLLVPAWIFCCAGCELAVGEAGASQQIKSCKYGKMCKNLGAKSPGIEVAVPVVPRGAGVVPRSDRSPSSGGRGDKNTKNSNEYLNSLGQWHAVYSLIDNRLLAHLVKEGGLFIPAGSPGFSKYLSFGRPWKTWTINEKLDGKAVAVAKMGITMLSFPMTAAQARESKWISLQLKSPTAQQLTILMNKKKVGSLKLAAGWQGASAAIPNDTLKAGENVLELRWGGKGNLGANSGCAAVEWIHWGSKPLQQKELATTPMVRGALHLPRGGGLDYYLYPDKGSRLSVKARPGATDSLCQLDLRVFVQQRSRLSKALSFPPPAPGRDARVLVDLDPIAGEIGRLELRAVGPQCRSLELDEANIVLPGAPPVVRSGKKPTNILFWLIDNVRADRYTAINPRTRVKTPVFDQLARTGTLYANAYIQGTESRVSHASIWTGLYPKQARLLAPKAKLSQSWVTLPEAMQKSGLLTAAWVANGFISEFWGFAQGFKLFRNTLHDGGGLTGKDLADHAIKFIEEKGKEPFYLYIGTIDPHVSWRGRQPWLQMYYPRPYNGPFQKNVFGKDVEKMASRKRQVSQEDRERIEAIYDSTVSYNDAQLGRVIKALEQKGIRDQTLIVITADHGEEFWDYGRIGHGHTCRQTLVGVPLLINYPPLFGQGVRVEEGVDVLSVMPTLLDALGQKQPPRVQGESLLALAQGIGRGYPRPSFATQYELAHTLRVGRWKIRVGGSGVPVLYDLQSREKEEKDLAQAHPTETRLLTDALSTFLLYQDRWRALRWGVATNHKAALADDLEQGRGPGPIVP